MLPDAAIRSAALVFLAVTVATTLQDLSLFSLHPISMALFFYLAVEGAMALSKKKRRLTMAPGPDAPKDVKVDERGRVPIPRVFQIDTHAALGFAAVSLAILGFGVEYYVKSINSRPHFATVHGLAGAVVVALACVQAVGGFANRQMRASRAQWRVHALSGGAAVLPGIAATAFLHAATWTAGAIQKNWMIGNQYFVGWGVAGEVALVVAAVGAAARVFEA
ncbi:hypothetical protein DFJ73DRAFT_841283 [Zopfochytrium polystomum]|nr:hypothetical protein DFJ73DRAFT_841283 [Zopfochytrium polystomum]